MPEENSLKVQDQTEYLERYDRQVQRYEKLKKKYDSLEAEKQRIKEQHDRIGAFVATLRNQTDLPVEFDPELWLAAIEKATVYADGRIVFTFKGGIEITEEMQRRLGAWDDPKFQAFSLCNYPHKKRTIWVKHPCNRFALSREKE